MVVRLPKHLTYNDILKKLGAVWYDLRLPESKAIEHMLHADEQLTGIVFGHYNQTSTGLAGRGMLVATNQRVMLLDKKLGYEHLEEIEYAVVSGVSYGRVGFGATVALHSRIGDITIRTYNVRCAQKFVEAVESVIFPPKVVLGNAIATNRT